MTAGASAPKRFPGFASTSQARHWDDVTAGVVRSRLGSPPTLTYFTPGEQATGAVLVDRLLDLASAPAVHVLAMIDARLAAASTDGWRYADMPEDGAAWRRSLRHLGEDAWLRCGTDLTGASSADQDAIINAVQHVGSALWHGLRADHVWSLWTRYSCTAFYAHPFAWDEIGFPGPAYPRGYKNIGVDRREPFEVRDRTPDDDPVRGQT